MVNKMKIGSIVELVFPPKGNVKTGARARVVDGPKTFPKKYQDLCDYLKNKKEDVDEFIWVVWDKNDSCGQEDGAYAKARFNLVVVNEKEPKDNNGRSSCFWCKTKQIQGFSNFYDVCPNCKK